MGLSYTSIRVKDLKKSVEFYTKYLGMKIIGRKSWVPGEKIVMLLSKDTGQRINLMHFSKGCMWYTPYKENGSELDHLMFEVDDAKKLYNKLVAKGAPAATELWEHGDMTMGYVKDPNGIGIGVRSESRKKK
ncbi:VOC family protein [Candidatus Micrarchaeota archaeon]|nr:VOC family protein [Candidatus Micrarchaeota archaeon]